MILLRSWTPDLGGGGAQNAQTLSLSFGREDAFDLQ